MQIKTEVAQLFGASRRRHCAPRRLRLHRRGPSLTRAAHASDPVLPAGPEGDAGRGADREPPADAARRHDPAGERGDLFLAAARLQGAAPARADRARGAGARRAHPAADADPAVGRPVARERALRRLRRRDAAHQGPPRARPALRADQRGADHRHLPLGGRQLQGAAAHALPHPVEVPRRGPPALRRDARPRVPDEGRLQLRPDEGRRAARLQPAHGQLHPHLRAHGAEGDPDARGLGPDRRRQHPRVPRARLHRRERGVLRPRGHRPHPRRPRDRFPRPRPGRLDLRRVDHALRPHRRDPRRGGLRRGARRSAGSRAAGSRSGRSSISAPSTPSRSRRWSPTRRASACPSTWARTASASAASSAR